MTNDKFKEREIKKLFSNSYDYPGKYIHDIHAIYDQDNDKYILIQYTYVDTEESLKDLAMSLDSLHEMDSSNYQELQKQKIIDEKGNYIEQNNNRKHKESNLVDKVKKMKTKNKECGEECDDCDCK